MKKLTQDQQKFFFDNGFLVIKGFLSASKVFYQLIQELEEYTRSFAPEFSLSEPQSVLNLDQSERRVLYAGLRYLPGIFRLSSSKEIQLVSQSLGLEMPGFELFNNIRMDLPDEDQFLFQWHQDITYNLGSVNGITYWVPLSTTNRKFGGIEVLPRSHKRGLWPCKVLNPENKSGLLSTNDIQITEEPAGKPLTIETEFGDLVVFSQLLMHRSLGNRSDKIRWTIQMRHCDFMEKYFREAGFPMGDNTTLDKTDYLEKWTLDNGEKYKST